MYTLYNRNTAEIFESDDLRLLVRIARRTIREAKRFNNQVVMRLLNAQGELIYFNSTGSLFGDIVKGKGW